MAKYKANSDFEKLKDRFFGVHKANSLMNGGVVEVTDPKLIPKKVLECLEEQGEKEAPKTKKKGS